MPIQDGNITTVRRFNLAPTRQTRVDSLGSHVHLADILSNHFGRCRPDFAQTASVARGEVT